MAEAGPKDSGGPPFRRRVVRCLAVLVLAGGALALAARYVVFPLFFWRLAEKCERPAFELLRTLDIRSADGRAYNLQLRLYEPYLVAEVRLPRGLSEQDQRSLGFRQVARYIFGGNLRRRTGLMGSRWAPRWMAAGEESEEISMTAPVQTETALSARSFGEEDPAADAASAADKVSVSFTMPSKYTSLRDLPVPSNPNITLRSVARHAAAAVGFRGPPPSPERVAALKSGMKIALQEIGLHPQRGHGAMVYQYHDPFATPNLLRWNEVVLLLAPSSLDVLQ
mmetsp:Transcript_97695/g.280682  ORF Transcript_97695/g.280682 Transcript_97695/m.280682 type:complete len:281 (+) Transcript_97695:79-921(+)